MKFWQMMLLSLVAMVALVNAQQGQAPKAPAQAHDEGAHAEPEPEPEPKAAGASSAPESSSAIPTHATATTSTEDDMVEVEYEKDEVKDEDEDEGLEEVDVVEENVAVENMKGPLGESSAAEDNADVTQAASTKNGAPSTGFTFSTIVLTTFAAMKLAH